MSTGRIMVGDLEEQVELPLVPLVMLAEPGADVDPPTVNDLGPLHVVVPLPEPVLIRDVRERLLDRRAYVGGLAESTHSTSSSGRASTGTTPLVGGSRQHLQAGSSARRVVGCTG
jgi:hypothetical protein